VWLCIILVHVYIHMEDGNHIFLYHVVILKGRENVDFFSVPFILYLYEEKKVRGTPYRQKLGEEKQSMRGVTVR
jgi:hypothetical protein